MTIFSNTSDKTKAGSWFFPNMNLLRYLLSFGILINHYNYLTGHDIPYFISHDRIGAFFVLSGFLMYHSYSKISDVGKFAAHRARRILPTYLFIVILCALGGVLVTSLSFPQYFSSPDFWKYLGANLSFLNWLQPSLPGVFDTPEFYDDTVNASLWTMKVECVLDLSVPLFVWLLSKINIRKEYLALSIIIGSMFIRLIFWELYTDNGSQIYEILSRQFFGQASFFYSGMLAYFLLERIYRYRTLVILTGLALYIIGPYIPLGWVFIAPVAVTLAAIGISTIGVTFTPFIHTNCISYNIFLLHFPIIQLCVYFGLNQYPVWISLGAGIAITLILSLLTNKYIDRAFIKKRRIPAR